MSLKSKPLYHGSSTNIKGNKLNPSKSCRTTKSTGKKTCDKVPKVYTTSNEKVALLFASKIPSKTAEIQKDGRVLFIFDKRYYNKLKGSGYIYEVERKDFKKGPRTKYNEYISNKRVKIVKKTFIPSVYKAVMKDKNIILILD